MNTTFTDTEIKRLQNEWCAHLALGDVAGMARTVEQIERLRKARTMRRTTSATLRAVLR